MIPFLISFLHMISKRICSSMCNRFQKVARENRSCRHYHSMYCNMPIGHTPDDFNHHSVELNPMGHSESDLRNANVGLLNFVYAYPGQAIFIVDMERPWYFLKVVVSSTVIWTMGSDKLDTKASSSITSTIPPEWMESSRESLVVY